MSVVASVFSISVDLNSDTNSASFLLQMSVDPDTMQSQAIFDVIMQRSIDGTFIPDYEVDPGSISVDGLSLTFGKLKS